MGRRGGPNFFRIGCLTVIVGIIVFLALILPTEFWWFLLGFGLIYAGVRIICCR